MGEKPHPEKPPDILLAELIEEQQRELAAERYDPCDFFEDHEGERIDIGGAMLDDDDVWGDDDD